MRAERFRLGQIGDDKLDCAAELCLGWIAHQRAHALACRDQLPYDLGPDRSGGAGNENGGSHWCVS